MKIETIKNWVILLFGIAIIILLGLNSELKNKNQYWEETTDYFFLQSFSGLCVSIQTTQPDPAKQVAYSRICWSMLSNTSYSKNQVLNDILIQIFQWGELGEISDKMDKSLSEKVVRLSHEMSNNKQYGRETNETMNKLVREIDEMMKLAVKT